MQLSNLILPTFDQPAPEQICPDVTVGKVDSVAAVLAAMTDPRQARGVRHTAFGLVMAVMVAVLAGAETITEITEHIEDLSAARRRTIGLTWVTAPSLSTIRRSCWCCNRRSCRKP